MKTTRFLLRFALCLGVLATPLLSLAQVTPDPAAKPVPPSQADLDLLAENEVIATARSAALAGDDNGVDLALVSRLSPGAQVTPSVSLARRAAGLCGWLRADNAHGRAMRVAERVLRQIGAVRERDEADRVERLYWESVLLADVLDQKAAALERLQEAEKLAPEDERILACAEQLARALAEFGR